MKNFSLKRTFSRKLSSSRLIDEPLTILTRFNENLYQNVEKNGSNCDMKKILKIFLKYYQFEHGIFFMNDINYVIATTLDEEFYEDTKEEIEKILEGNEYVHVESVKFKNEKKFKNSLFCDLGKYSFALLNGTDRQLELIKNHVIFSSLLGICSIATLKFSMEKEPENIAFMHIDKKNLKIRSLNEKCNSLFQEQKLGKEKRLKGHRITKFITNSKESIHDFLNSEEIRRQVWFASNGCQLLVSKGVKKPENDGVCIVDIFDIDEQTENIINSTDENENEDLLGHVSHEIRTPLNGIITMLSILSTTNLDEKQKKLLEILQYSSFNLMTLINDMLDIGKLNNDKMVLRETETSLVSIIGALYNSAIEEAKKKGITLTKNIQEGTPDNIYVDPIRVRQILVNLLGNAIKFTNEGFVDISVKFKKIHKTRAFFTIAIKDTGIGIDKSNFELIFQPYKQVDQSLTRLFEGSGLGLSISRKLARLMAGGDILVESTLNRGTTFTLTFEATLIDSSLLFEDFENRLNGLNALIVDDMPESRLFLLNIFQKWGIKTEMTGSAIEAEQIYLPKIHKYDFVVVDFRMPGKDGRELGNLIKERSGGTPLILTSSSDNTVVDSSVFVGCLLKPFSEVSLFAIILKSQGIMSDQIKAVLEKKNTRRLERFDRHYNPRKKNILVVEDGEMNRKVMMTLLEALGYTKINVVENGEDMINQCLDARNKFDMILLDMKMPKKDGFEASKELTETYAERRIQRPKILAVTAFNNNKKLQSWQQKGYIDGIVSKPVDMNILKMKMEQKLNKLKPLGRYSNAV